VWKQRRRGWSHEREREDQELNTRMCSHNIESEPRSQTFTLHGSPSLRSSLVLTKVTDSAESARPIHYSTFDASPPSPDPSLSPTSSLMQMHNRDVISEHTVSPSPSSSLTHCHVCTRNFICLLTRVCKVIVFGWKPRHYCSLPS
jgi:hypothetical protein